MSTLAALPSSARDAVHDDSQFGFLVELGDFADGFAAVFVAEAGAVEHLGEHQAVAFLFEQVVVRQALQEVAGTGFGFEGDSLASFGGVVEQRLQRAQDFLAEEVEVLVGRLLVGDEHDFGGLGAGDEAGGPEGHQADSRRLIGGGSAEQVQSVRQAVMPRRDHANGGGAGVRSLARSALVQAMGR